MPSDEFDGYVVRAIMIILRSICRLLTKLDTGRVVLRKIGARYLSQLWLQLSVLVCETDHCLTTALLARLLPSAAHSVMLYMQPRL